MATRRPRRYTPAGKIETEETPMALRSIAILSPGDMGGGVGRALAERGFDVVTCLAGRGEETRARAARAGFRDLPDLETLVAQCDLVVSILPPEAATGIAREVAAAMGRAGKTPPYADCNAVSPETTRAIGDTLAAVGARYIDGGIIGAAPGKSDRPTRLYVSGPGADLLSALDGEEIALRVCGAEIGRASAIKMCYAAVSKGTNTLHTAALLAAEALGVGEALRAEFADSMPAAYRHMRTMVPRLPADAARWIREMEEIAQTLESVGVTPKFHQGARDIFALLAATPFAAETRETLDRSRTLEQSLAVYLAQLDERDAAE
jgi:3-hydroxyisobutyrate dehydrogenase-like beta-hydroxyacid dehydrogenase